jgi:rare lipoprotein A
MKIFFKFLCLFLLFGCSETTFLINSAKRIGSWGDEPIYKVGNPYKINGKWYYPAVDYQYDEVGIASWYGPGFHGKTTANGEVFDQNKISAAHRTLPMPSVVKVTNLENGLVLEKVRINDRGPFARNRIIDLSKKAAEELGFIKNGVAKVRVEILEDESRKYVSTDQKNNYVAEAAEVTEISKKNLLSSPERKEKVVEKKTEENLENSILTNKELLIQVGAFTDHRNAKTLSEKLSEFKAYINRVFINNKYLYRVRIGPINNLDLANDMKRKLFELGYTSSHLVMK